MSYPACSVCSCQLRRRQRHGTAWLGLDTCHLPALLRRLQGAVTAINEALEEVRQAAADLLEQ